MDTLASFGGGLLLVLQPDNLMYCFIGVFLGTFIGVLPGIGSMAAIAMILPITFYLDPTPALVMIAGLFYGAEYGGSTASILLNVPGTPAASITAIEGHQLAKKGRAGVALFSTAIASFGGGIIGMIVIAVLAPSLAQLALSFAPADYFAVILLGLIAASAVSNGGALKGIAMVVTGLMLGTIGIDMTTGITRFTMGIPELRDGVNIVIVAMGLFGVSEVIASIRGARSGTAVQTVDYNDFYPSREEWKSLVAPILRGGAIGSFIGALPGTGQTIAAAIAYAVEKKVSPQREKFGTGVVPGVAVPEAANNSATQTAFIPTLTLGVPGSPPMAIVIGALMIYGITPGPRLLTEQPDMFWGLVASFLVGNIMLLVLNVPLIGIWVRASANSVQVHISDDHRADLHGRLQPEQQRLRYLADAHHRRLRLRDAAVPVRARAASSRLCSRADDGGTASPHDASFPRGSVGFSLTSDQRHASRRNRADHCLRSLLLSKNATPEIGGVTGIQQKGTAQ